MTTAKIRKQAAAIITAGLLAMSLPVSVLAAPEAEETAAAGTTEQSTEDSSRPEEMHAETGNSDQGAAETADDPEPERIPEDEKSAPEGDTVSEDGNTAADSSEIDAPDPLADDTLDAGEADTAGEGLTAGELSEDESQAAGVSAGQSAENEGEDVPVDLYYGDECFLIREVSLQMEYDDRILFADVEDLDSELVLAAVEEYQVTSRQVSQGSVTDNPDENVVTSWKKGKGLYAVGTGTADLLLVAPADLTDTAAAREGQVLRRQIPAVRLHVTVRPAALTLMYMLGQSNMEGHSTSGKEFIGGDSILGRLGTVYSTYIPSNINWTKMVTGSKYDGYNNGGADPLSFIAESLTSARSVLSEDLAYSLNALTEEGKGKSGIDGALAWNYNQLTGSKVWTINAAVGGSYISQWLPGGDIYQAVLPALQAVGQVAVAEQGAGHYSVANTLALWQQGEHDSKKGTTEDTYLSGFGRIVQALTADLSVEKIGLISTRSSTGDYLTKDELNMDGVRTAQYYMGGDSDLFSNIFMVSNVNEAWTGNKSVKAYFEEAYPDGSLDYPLRAKSTLKDQALPDTVEEVHPWIHYTQAGYNENGLTAARGMFDVISGNILLDTYSMTGFFRNSSGSKITGLTSDGTKAGIYFMTYQSAGLKRVAYKVSDTASASYNKKTGVLTFKKPASVTLTAYDTITGKTLVAINVKFKGWYTTGGKTYYYKDYKTKVTGWQTINGFKYYFDGSGAQVLGLKTISGSLYYFFKSTVSGHYKGVMATGWVTTDGKKYYFDSAGKAVTGFKTISKAVYYFRPAAAGSNPKYTMATGWQTINGFKYYFGTDGKEQTGFKTISGSIYYFWPDTAGKHYKGTMAKGWQTINGFRYYFGTDGKEQTGFRTISGSTYYFWPKTEGSHYKGTMAKGWQTLNGFKYYFGTDGKQQTGWKTISGKTYYFWPSTAGKHYKGTMATGKQTIGGKTYNFGTDGVRK